MKAEYLALLKPIESYLLRMALAITCDRHDAQDALQEAVLSTFVARDNLRDRQQFKAWIKKIVAHKCSDLLRRRGRVVPMGYTADFLPDTKEHCFDDLLIWDVVGGLPSHYAQIITLRYAADLKQREIAEILGLPVGTVKSRLHNALKKLRQQLEVGGETDEVSGR